jgi:thiamine pyrophosphokinase
VPLFQPTPASRAVIFANGEIANLAAAAAALEPGDWLIAADGGLRYLDALGLNPHLLIGDLDSVPPERVEAVRAAGVPIQQFPTRKDETDLELALGVACAAGVRETVILGALGGRWDHTLANLLLLAHPRFAPARIRVLDGHQQLYLVHGQAEITGQPGDTVSLVPLSGDVSGITTTGLDYPLTDGTLEFGSSRGVSNALTGTTATVRVTRGLLVCVVSTTAVSATPGK